MDQREWDYGARMSRERRAAEAWPTRETDNESDPRWASLTDTGSMAPSDEALSWQRRADAWAQQADVEVYGGGGQNVEPAANRWSDVASTGRTAFPADGQGWRTETSEWRATGARWRQTTEWRSSTGSHVWRSTTEAWQSEEELAAAANEKQAIPGTAWPTPEQEEAGNSPASWQRRATTPVEQTPSWQRPSTSTPSWQRGTGSTPSWQRSTGSWSTRVPEQQPGENTTGLARWERTDAPGWQTSPAEDAQHLVRDDDRAAWQREQSPRRGRRRAPEPDPAPSGGSGWSTEPSQDSWERHTDTGNIQPWGTPARSGGARTDEPEPRRSRRRADEPSAPADGGRPRRYNQGNADWREDTASWTAEPDTSNWTRDPDTGQWSRAEDDPRVLAWRAEAARRESMKSEPDDAPAPRSGRRARRDEPVGGVPGGPLPSSGMPSPDTAWPTSAAPDTPGSRGMAMLPIPRSGMPANRQLPSRPSSATPYETGQFGAGPAQPRPGDTGQFGSGGRRARDEDPAEEYGTRRRRRAADPDQGPDSWQARRDPAGPLPPRRELPAGGSPSGGFPPGPSSSGGFPDGPSQTGSFQAGSFQAGGFPAGSSPAGSSQAGSSQAGSSQAGSSPAGGYQADPFRGGAYSSGPSSAPSRPEPDFPEPRRPFSGQQRALPSAPDWSADQPRQDARWDAPGDPAPSTRAWPGTTRPDQPRPDSRRDGQPFPEDGPSWNRTPSSPTNLDSSGSWNRDSTGSWSRDTTSRSGGPDSTGSWNRDASDPSGSWSRGTSDPSGSWNRDAPDSPGSWNRGAPDSPGSWNRGAPDSPGSWNRGAPDSPGSWNRGAPDSPGSWNRDGSSRPEAAPDGPNATGSWNRDQAGRPNTPDTSGSWSRTTPDSSGSWNRDGSGSTWNRDSAPTPSWQDASRPGPTRPASGPAWQDSTRPDTERSRQDPSRSAPPWQGTARDQGTAREQGTARDDRGQSWSDDVRGSATTPSWRDSARDEPRPPSWQEPRPDQSGPSWQNPRASTPSWQTPRDDAGSRGPSWNDPRGNSDGPSWQESSRPSWQDTPRGDSGRPGGSARPVSGTARPVSGPAWRDDTSRAPWQDSSRGRQDGGRQDGGGSGQDDPRNPSGASWQVSTRGPGGDSWQDDRGGWAGSGRDDRGPGWADQGREINDPSRYGGPRALPAGPSREEPARPTYEAGAQRALPAGPDDRSGDDRRKPPYGDGPGDDWPGSGGGSGGSYRGNAASGPAWPDPAQQDQRKPVYGSPRELPAGSGAWPDPLSSPPRRASAPGYGSAEPWNTRGANDAPPPAAGYGEPGATADWLAAERAIGRRSIADYRDGAGQGGETDWRQSLAPQSDLAEGESRRYDTSDFPPFRPSGSATVDGSANLALSATSVISTAPDAATPPPPAAWAASTSAPATRDPASWATSDGSPATGENDADTSWPPRRSTGAFQGTGSYERRPVTSGLVASSADLLDPDDDEEDEETSNSPLAAVGYTVVWYGVPVILFVAGMFLLNSGQRSHALDTLADAAPEFAISLALSMLVAFALRRATTAWKSASVGLAAAVVGGGLATVLSSAITGNSLS